MKENQTIGSAIEHLKKGGKAKRVNWNGKDQFIVLAKMKSCITADGIICSPSHSNIGDNFILFVGTSGYQCGWLASQADMLAEDWILFE